MKSFIIEEIKKNYTITDYLSKRGFHPAKIGSDKSIYLCPFPDHSNDSHPSFTVFHKSDHEDFYCFGCKRGVSIIQLVMGLENISARDAISKLSRGLKIDISDEIDFLVREVIQESSNIEDRESVLFTAMHLSLLSHSFLQKVSFEKSEVEICDKLFKVIDNAIINRDKKSLDEIKSLIPAKFKDRYIKYVEKNKTKWMIKPNA